MLSHDNSIAYIFGLDTHTLTGTFIRKLSSPPLSAITQPSAEEPFGTTAATAV